VEDVEDCIAAIERLAAPATETHLSDVLESVQDLVRQSTRPIGGMPLPDLSYDPVLYTPRPMAVATLAGLINDIAAALAGRSATSGLVLDVTDEGATVEVDIWAQDLDDSTARDASRRVSKQLDGDPSIHAYVEGDTIRVGFAVRSEGSGEDGSAPSLG
jgi:hypothetical protein